MKGWLINKNGSFELKDIVLSENKLNSNTEETIKIKITKSLIGISDILRYTGEYEPTGYVLGSSGIGIAVNDFAVDSLSPICKGDRLYINPYRPCKECFYCKSNDKKACSDLLVAGEDYDGFLREFVDAKLSDVYAIPENISDTEALFIETVALALNIIDKLNIQKGEHVVILGADNFGIIMAQILKYYQSIPVIIDNDNTKVNLAKECGIYYSISKDSDLVKEVSEITGGRLAPHIIYNQDSNIPLNHAFSLAGYNAQIAISAIGKGSNIVTFAPAVKKEIKLFFINTGFGSTEASINLIANKAIDLSKLPIQNVNFNDCEETFKKLAEDYISGKTVDETIVNIL